MPLSVSESRSSGHDGKYTIKPDKGQSEMFSLSRKDKERQAMTLLMLCLGLLHDLW